MIFIDKAMLIREYIEKKKTTTEIGDQLGVGHYVISRLMKRHGIPARSGGQPKGCIPWNKGKRMNPESCRKMSLAKKGKPLSLEHRRKLKARPKRFGEKAPDWKGGITIDRKGYLLKHCPDHPYAKRNGYVAYHRLILEKKLGRYLLPNELAHHIDFNKTNNDPDNLTPMTNGEHTQYHFQMKYLFEHLVGA